MILLDTNVLSEAMKPSPDDSLQAWLDEQVADTLYLFSIPIAELLYGIGAEASARTGSPRLWMG